MILQQLGKSQPVSQLKAMANQYKNVMQMLQNAGNPNALLSQVLESNPRSAEVMKLLDSTNGNVDAAIRIVCNQKGIDYQEFMNAINSNQ